MDDSSLHFLEPEGELCSYEKASVVILPVPFERTTSYGQGTAEGPAALLRASWHVETYDQELDMDPSEQGIATLPLFQPTADDLGTALEQLTEAAEPHLRMGKFLVTLGGEHSLSTATIRAASRSHPDLGVVQFDAHADLRDSYEGTPHSHACIMRRVVDDLGLQTLAVGIRSLSTPEARWIAERDLPVIWGRQLDEADARFERLLEALPETIYLTFDIDYFDPSLVPCTGTPEPGGGFWTPTLRLLRHLFEHKRVVAMDVVELSPRAEQPASDFVAAKLVYKCLGYRNLRSHVAQTHES